MNTDNTSIKLLTWMASNRDPRFLENVIYALEKKTGKKVSTVYYLYGGKEKDKAVVNEILGRVQKFFCKKLNFVPIYAGVFNPTNHEEVMVHAMNALEPMLGTMGDICINITSGTPTMSTAWMFLKALDYFKGRATFYDAPKYQPNIHPSDDVVPKEEQTIDLFNFSAAFNIMKGIRAANVKIQKGALKETFLGSNSRSPLRQLAYEKIKQFSQIDNVPMLILGERGVGKSATVKHLIKEFKKKEVFEAACGAMDSNLADSTLFGHKKGAFTGALDNHKGLFERADKNILFLDEIQDLPKSTQRKLLRTIQEKDHPYEPLGSEEEKKANVQLIFATNNTMEELCEKLYPDFFDRIKMFTVRIPSLRECKVDIEDDWNTIWNSCRPTERRKDLKFIPEEAPWDDNLREYFNDDINLESNIRSLQKVAYQIIAWEAWDDPQKRKRILDDLHQENLEIHNSLQKISRKAKASENSLPVDFEDSSVLPFEQEFKEKGLEYKWTDVVKMFKEKLAVQAVKQCGMSIPNASKLLKCDKNTISDVLPEGFKAKRN